jgi:hypothetical protein
VNPTGVNPDTMREREREREREIYEDSIRPHQAASCFIIDAMLKILGCHLQLMQKDTDYQDKL